MMQKNLNRGLRPTGRIMLVCFLVCFLLLFMVTGVSFAMIAHTGRIGEENLLDMALRAQLGTGIVQSRRGTIFDRNGVEIASQHPSHTMYANFHPNWGSIVEDIEDTAQQLAQVIAMDRADIARILAREGAEEHAPIWQVEFGHAGRRLSFSQKNEIDALDLAGIYFRPDLTRFYPNGEFAAHTIGYTWFDANGEIIGAMGLESYFNAILTATNGRFQFQSDRFGFTQPGHKRQYVVYPLDGYDIKLTLDATIQSFLESAMDEVLEHAEAKSIVAVVMDARTGEILAAGSRPTFDPNQRNPAFYANRIVYPFEPGSTLKIFTYAAAINEGNYDGSQTFMSGSRRVGNTILRDHPGIPARERTFDEGFYVSTNTSIIDLLRDAIGLDVFVDYLTAFGFGETLGFPTDGEASGALPDRNDPLNVYTSGYGQGMTVTPIQMLQATSAILNEGAMIRPQLIAHIYNPNTNEIIHQFEREVVGQPITAETASQMRELMRGVVHNDIGTGHIHYLLDVESGGKTGTAQIPGGPTGFLEDVHLYSYIGFAPLDDPEMIMFIAIEKTGGGHVYAGQIYRTVMNNTLNYLGLTGNQVSVGSTTLPEFERVMTPRVSNLSTEDAISSIEALGLTPIVIGDGRDVFNQLPVANTPTLLGSKVFIQTDTVDRLPDFTGWSRTEMTQYGRLLSLDITITGQGLAVWQNLRPYRVVRQGDALTILLE
ncbi:MAG: penicillin-binding transpeptidase domain-containing protein [Defluviitaleaceae bacterium]|nr:penicillin-binding transpeptidase domain-containing protein [Defluviitaleaceae bacterium]